jgi:cellulose biosynthesis protein BcsQ
MARKIAVYNKKGGVAKTTDAVNLAASLAAMKKPDGSPKYRVLLNDMDPQQDASNYLGVGSYFRSDEDENRDLGLVLKGEKSLSEVMYTYKAKEWVGPNTKGDDVYEVTEVTDFDDDGQEIKVTRKYREVEIPNFKIVPAYTNIVMDKPPVDGNYVKLLRAMKAAGLDNQSHSEEYLDEDNFRASLDPFFMSEKLKEIEADFDFIIFDCPPSWDRLSKMAVLASDQIIIPLTPGEFERIGVVRVMEQLVYLKRQYGKKPDLIFAVMNKIRGNVPRHIAYWKKNAKQLGGLMSDTGIPMTEEVTVSVMEQTPFGFTTSARFKNMRETFQQLANEIEKKYQEREVRHV